MIVRACEFGQEGEIYWCAKRLTEGYRFDAEFWAVYILETDPEESWDALFREAFDAYTYANMKKVV